MESLLDIHSKLISNSCVIKSVSCLDNKLSYFSEFKSYHIILQNLLRRTKLPVSIVINHFHGVVFADLNG